MGAWTGRLVPNGRYEFQVTQDSLISKLYGLVCGPDPEANQLDRCANAAGTQGLLSG